MQKTPLFIYRLFTVMDSITQIPLANFANKNFEQADWMKLSQHREDDRSEK